MNTLTANITKAIKDGYIENFRVVKNQLCTSSDKCYHPEQVQVVNFYRFEGESDPGDSAILYIIETTDGAKGTLVDAYGMYADPTINTFMDQVEGIHKKTK